MIMTISSPAKNVQTRRPDHTTSRVSTGIGYHFCLVHHTGIFTTRLDETEFGLYRSL